MTFDTRIANLLQVQDGITQTYADIDKSLSGNADQIQLLTGQVTDLGTKNTNLQAQNDSLVTANKGLATNLLSATQTNNVLNQVLPFVPLLSRLNGNPNYKRSLDNLVLTANSGGWIQAGNAGNTGGPTKNKPHGTWSVIGAAGGGVRWNITPSTAINPLTNKPTEYDDFYWYRDIPKAELPADYQLFVDWTEFYFPSSSDLVNFNQIEWEKQAWRTLAKDGKSRIYNMAKAIRHDGSVRYFDFEPSAENNALPGYDKWNDTGLKIDLTQFNNQQKHQFISGYTLGDDQVNHLFMIVDGQFRLLNKLFNARKLATPAANRITTGWQIDPNRQGTPISVVTTQYDMVYA